ncbi:hypothetical protein CFB40_27515 [Burkholderia sp. AU31652]|nr:hypothetical protein CFB40_27515 [Burkholderia sp. AU31652]
MSDAGRGMRAWPAMCHRVAPFTRPCAPQRGCDGAVLPSFHPGCLGDAAVSAGLHGVSEVKHDTVASDTDRLARSIAKRLATQNATNAWLRTVSAS